MLEQGSPRNARRPCDIRQRERQLHVGLDEIDAAPHITRRNLVFPAVQGVSIVARLPEEQLGDDKLLVHRQHGWVDSLRPGIVKVGDERLTWRRSLRPNAVSRSSDGANSSFRTA